MPAATTVRDPGPGHQRHAAHLQAGADVDGDADDEDEDQGPRHGQDDQGGGGHVSPGLLAGGDTGPDVIY